MKNLATFAARKKGKTAIVFKGNKANEKIKKSLQKRKRFIPLQPAKKGKQRLFKAEKANKKIKNKFAEVKKVRTFAVPKQGH